MWTQDWLILDLVQSFPDVESVDVTDQMKDVGCLLMTCLGLNPVVLRLFYMVVPFLLLCRQHVVSTLGDL